MEMVICLSGNHISQGTWSFRVDLNLTWHQFGLSLAKVGTSECPLRLAYNKYSKHGYNSRNRESQRTWQPWRSMGNSEEQLSSLINLQHSMS